MPPRAGHLRVALPRGVGLLRGALRSRAAHRPAGALRIPHASTRLKPPPGKSQLVKPNKPVMSVQSVKQKIESILNSTTDSNAALSAICQTLHADIPHMDWVGFYFMNDEKQQLELGPYVGEPTEHTLIPYGRGICGQVAQTGQTLNVPDVSKSDNYLACSLKTKSEIVIPLYTTSGRLIGQLDIDSHVLNRFDPPTAEFLEEICTLISKRLYNH